MCSRSRPARGPPPPTPPIATHRRDAHIITQIRHLLLLAAVQGARCFARPQTILMPGPPLRRSGRFSASGVDDAPPPPPEPPPRKKRKSNAANDSPPAEAKRSANGSPSKSSKKTKGSASPTKAAAVLMTHAPRDREEAAWKAGIPLVVGTDEAGRGPLAGPVVAAACALPADLAPILGVGDSKTILDEDVREQLYEKIVSTPGVIWSARIVSAARIDEINILMASLEAMRLSVVDVLETAGCSGAASPPHNRALVCVDGPFSPWKAGDKYVDFQTPALPEGAQVEVEPIKKGDAKVYCIAAASIIAKVTRDRAMRLYDEQWPMYDLKGHKGYPTPSHVGAIAKHGACAIHRRTFAPLKTRDLPTPSVEEIAKVDEIASSLPTGCRAAQSKA